jgi:exonuclease III
MIRFAVFMFAFYSLVFPFRASAYGFRLVSYNVENLFDCHHAGTEYDEYIPGGKYGWNETLFKKKIANLSKVLIAVKGDILALQEVESEAALLALRDYLIQKGENYQYFAIAGGINSTVKCALLSKFPISAKKEIPINYKGLRSVLRADIDIKGHNFTVYVNHWKSMRGPESLRVKSAETLMTDARRLSASHDYVFAGDFNSDYDAGTAFSGSKKNNDTNGITGINHVLKTIAGGVQVTGKMLSNDKKNLIHYNLWNELPEKKKMVL